MTYTHLWSRSLATRPDLLNVHVDMTRTHHQYVVPALSVASLLPFSLPALIACACVCVCEEFHFRAHAPIQCVCVCVRAGHTLGGKPTQNGCRPGSGHITSSRAAAAPRASLSSQGEREAPGRVQLPIRIRRRAACSIYKHSLNAGKSGRPQRLLGVWEACREGAGGVRNGPQGEGVTAREASRRHHCGLGLLMLASTARACPAERHCSWAFVVTNAVLQYLQPLAVIRMQVLSSPCLQAYWAVLVLLAAEHGG